MPKARLLRTKAPHVLGYPSNITRAEIIRTLGRDTRRVMNALAVSKIPVEEKEELANLFLFILNVLDIENAKIKYEKIRPEATAAGPKTLPKE